MSQKKPHKLANSLRRRAAKPAFGLLCALMIGCMVSAPFVNAQSIQQQINNLQTQNDQSESSVNALQLQATSYQDAINQVQTQISAIQGAINASQAQQTNLEGQIQAAQTQLNQQKQILGDDIKSMYLNGQMTTIEELATSKSLSDFVDAETYRSAVQGEVQSTLTQITKLQNQLKDQKEQVDSLLATQQAQQAQLDSDQQQQQQLLSYNQAQQDQYNQQIQANQSQISSLEAQQAAINESGSSAIEAPSGGTGGNCATPNYPVGGTYYYQGSTANAPNGSYPMDWCNAGQDSATTAGGFPNRECTSFAYWYFTTQESGHAGFYVTGNANQWAYTANRPVDQTPADGAIAVDTSGPFGHVMIVVATPGQSYGGGVVPAGYIDTISMNDDYNGHFFAMQRSSAGFYYIH